MPAMSEVKVTGLCTYPLKSCRVVDLEESLVTPRGLQYDRDFLVIDDEDDFVSQRKVPELALIVPQIGEGSLTLSAPGMKSIVVPLEPPREDARVVIATVHGKPVAGQIVADELNEWVTDFLPQHRQNRAYRVLHVREDMPRFICERYRLGDASNRLGFADGHPILLASETSLAQLNTELDEPVPMNRFRPNIIIGGEDLPAYEEDHWLELRIGAMTAYVVKACDRCVIPDVDQATAVTGKAVRRALVTRRGVNAHDRSNSGVFFAQNINHVYAPGLTLRVGDPVQVIRRSAEANVVLGAR